MITIITTSGNVYDLDEAGGRVRCERGLPGTANEPGEWLKLGEFRAPEVGEKFFFNAEMTFKSDGATFMAPVSTSTVEAVLEIEPLSV